MRVIRQLLVTIDADETQAERATNAVDDALRVMRLTYRVEPFEPLRLPTVAEAARLTDYGEQ